MATELKLEGTDIRYVRGREKVLADNGVCLTVGEWDAAVQNGTISALLSQRKIDGCKTYDWEHALKEGELKEVTRVRPPKTKYIPLPEIGKQLDADPAWETHNKLTEPEIDLLLGEVKKSPFITKEELVKETGNPEAVNALDEEAKAVIDNWVDKTFGGGEPPIEVYKHSVDSKVLTQPEVDAFNATCQSEGSPKVYMEYYDLTKPEETLKKQKEEEEKLKVYSQWVDEAIDGAPATKPEPPKAHDSTPIIMWSSAFTAAGSIFVSAFHTTRFMKDVLGRSWGMSLAIGILLIVVSSTAFTSARYFFREKSLTKLFGLLFTVLGLAVMGFSMFSTMGVSYQTYVWSEAEMNEEALTMETLFDRAAAEEEMSREEVDRLDAEIGREREEQDRLARIIETHKQNEERFNTEELWALRNVERQRLNAAESAASASRARVAVLQSQRDEAWRNYAGARKTGAAVSGVVASRRGGVFQFVSGVIGVSEETLMFLVYSVPAALLDILAPFSVSTFFLMYDTRHKRRRTLHA